MSSYSDETAISVLVPEAECVVSDLRAEGDPSAAEGAPAHVTLLYPFCHPDEIDRFTVDELSAFFRSQSPFACNLVGICGFPGVVYLVPESPDPFDRLTGMLASQYPDTPPYGGAFERPIPHLTVAQESTGIDLDAVCSILLERAEAVFPLKAVVAEACLLVKRGDRWRCESRFPFASPI
jgi:2'-5' RNA ligase